MIAFRYRGVENLDFSTEIIEEQRLYCASAETINDWDEGAFAVSYFKDTAEAKEISRRVQEYQ